ncbi:ABC transporter permease subunit [Streptomyces goshikiensis]|uniref:ABC transporter permease subunit n=1 Tax=Streptomyces goshikiensis TaxID=1942 RepID=UPI00365C1BF4
MNWLGPAPVTPAVIGAYLWAWTGSAMVLIRAGLAAIPRDALEAARLDGGSESRIFSRLVLPLGRPASPAWPAPRSLLFADGESQPLTVARRSPGYGSSEATSAPSRRVRSGPWWSRWSSSSRAR